MMKTFLRYGLLASLPMALAGCTDHELQGGDSLQGEDFKISLIAEIDQLNETRADDSGFADADRIGLYAVPRDKQGIPGSLTDEDNIGNNVAYTFSESGYQWTGDRDLYFPDDKTEVDFYSYYPYTTKIETPESYFFSVQKNQNGDGSDGKMPPYEKSDFLWGSVAGITSKSGKVNITFRHMLSAVKVTLTKGEGFTDDEWLALDKSVMAQGTIHDCHIDLSSGKVTPDGSGVPRPVMLNNCGGCHRGVVVPQQVAAGATLLTINVGADSYAFVRKEAMTYMPSKMHNFTIDVSKKTAGGKYEYTLTSESVTPWESDPISHNGKMKEYVVVNVPSAGEFEEAIKNAGIDPVELVNLKVTGEMGEGDFYFLRTRCKFLEALNLREVTLRHSGAGEYWEDWQDYTIPNSACEGMEYLTTVVFPEKLKRIGQLAFRSTNLSGSLVFPEGLEYIGGSAFSNWGAYTSSNTNLSGTLTLPSTLKYIGGSAFENCDFTGELVLPEGLEFIGAAAFTNCRYMTGEIHLPSTLKELGGNAFSGMKGITGHIDMPRGQNYVPSLGMPGINSVTLPDAPEKICFGAFWDVPLKGDLVIPESVRVIEANAFPGTKLSHIFFPPELEFLEDNVCSWNHFLIDTVTVPSKVIIIKERAFAFCEKIDAVILPKSLEKIGREAFAGCTSLTYLRCDATVPPTLDESAFNGVAKDNFTIEVPEKSVDLYRQAPGWKEFRRIAAYKNFVARPSKYNVLNKGGKLEIILNADGDWELTDLPSWCHVDKKSGSKKTIINLTVDPMNHGSENRFGKVNFKLKNDSYGHETHINVGQYDYEYDEDQYLQLQKASKGSGIDIFFCGDGYDAIDISNGTYLMDMTQEMEYLFGVEPYTTYRDYFNVYTSFALSEDSGVEDVNHWRRTKFHSANTGRDADGLRTDWMGAMNYCAETVPPIIEKPHPRVGCILVVNTTAYEGVTYLGESFCSVVTKSDSSYPFDARGVLQHEAGGHGIGWLGDEYIYHMADIYKCPCTCCNHADNLRSDHSWGYALNLTLDGSFKGVPWYHLLKHPSYTDIVDIYDGGYFHKKGVYRSEHNSCMNNNVPYFSTWSRQLIVGRILDWAGESFSLDSFYAKDSREYGKDFTQATRSNALDAYIPARPGKAPVRITNYKFGKKGGKK